ncbi:MAG: hypothetical protein AAGA56_07675 [Myxococcota bacterium]
MSAVTLAVALLASFAGWLLIHVVLAVRLMRRAPHWRGVVALFLPPLAPWWAAKARWSGAVYAWLGALLLYVTILIALKLT